MDWWKTLFEIIYYIAASLAVLGAVWTYRSNYRLEQSRWASSFYETTRYKAMRELLDCPTDLEKVNRIVESEAGDFTDYLNFFEHIAIFTKSKRLNRKDVTDSFDYYLNCLKKLEKVREYILDKEKGYENLREFLELEK
ncbi:MAG TPA: hypothetical protein VKB86_02280 [Pyrinomonadaceae bacterium]|nr:hypothetical protein [Pyrinomonadaceae bacterium]